MFFLRRSREILLIASWKRWQMEVSWGSTLVPFWACLSGWGASQTHLPTPCPPVLPQPHLVPPLPQEERWREGKLLCQNKR